MEFIGALMLNCPYPRGPTLNFACIESQSFGFEKIFCQQHLRRNVGWAPQQSRCGFDSLPDNVGTADPEIGFAAHSVTKLQAHCIFRALKEGVERTMTAMKNDERGAQIIMSMMMMMMILLPAATVLDPDALIPVLSQWAGLTRFRREINVYLP